MANEAQINVSLNINKGSKVYRSQPNAFTANVSGNGGPSPGTFTATTGGTIVNLTNLTVPGLYRIQNLDANNWIEYGIYDRNADVFYPLNQCLAAETFIARFSPNLGTNEPDPDTGTGAFTGSTAFMVRANGAPCEVLVEAFDS
jgi:hypothetical protein